MMKNGNETMNPKLPYYMTYPVPFQFDAERKEERDLQYLKSLYPYAAKQILPYIEDECDRMEYKGCMLYDEYPDKLQLQMMIRRIVKSCDAAAGMEHLVAVMLYHELYERRCNYRKNAQRFY